MFAFKTDIGRKRTRNEDATYIVENQNHDIFMLCFDGMGGHKRGDVASSIARDFMKEEFLKKKHFFCKIDMYFWLKRLIEKTNKKLNDYSLLHNDTKGMGTTVSCILIHKKHTLMCYIGDTRCYLIKNGKMIQKSKDETYVEYLYETGKISFQEKAKHPARNIIINALGCRSQVSVNLEFIKDSYEHLLICSDGLYNMVSEHDICSLICKEEVVDIKVEQLIALANENGGKDNISVALYSKGE